MTKFITINLILFFTFTLFAGKRDIGELPHGNVYLVNPEVDDGKTTTVELEVDRSGVLKNDFIHVLKEVKGREREISVKINELVNVLPATVYYHALNAYFFMLNAGFPPFEEEIKIILSFTKEEPLAIFPESRLIVFGKGGLNKHALDSDIISSAIVSMFLMSSMGISSFEFISEQLKEILYGISYYLSCSLAKRPVFASSVLNINMTDISNIPKKRHNENNISHKIARFLWKIENALSPDVITILLVNSVFYMNEKSSLDDFIYNLLESDELIFNSLHISYIYEEFNKIF